MKNNLLLDLKPLKSRNIDLPSSNDFFDLAVADKIEDGELNDVTNRLTEVFEKIFYDATGCDDEKEEEGEEEEEIYLNSDEEIHFEIWERLKEDFESEFNRPENDFLYAGYVDCMDEAIRFLIEEENISPEHPVVINLKTHLEKSKEKMFASFAACESESNEFRQFATNPRSEEFFSQGSIFVENFQNCRDSG